MAWLAGRRFSHHLALCCSGSGVGFHRHGEAWNGVVHGRKRFFLFRPEWKSGLLGIAPDLPYDGLQWFKRFFSKTLSGTALAPIECVTTPGKIYFLYHFAAAWPQAHVRMPLTIYPNQLLYHIRRHPVHPRELAPRDTKCRGYGRRRRQPPATKLGGVSDGPS